MEADVMERCQEHDGCMADIRTALYGKPENVETGVLFIATNTRKELLSFEERTKKHRTEDQSVVESIRTDIKEIKNTVNSMEKDLEKNTEYIKKQKEGFSAKVNWFYKAFITAMVTYLVMNIHLIIQALAKLQELSATK